MSSDEDRDEIQRQRKALAAALLPKSKRKPSKLQQFMEAKKQALRDRAEPGGPKR